MIHITQPRERPILFNGDMVRALLAGTKTQTRRLVKPQPDDTHNGQPYWHIGGLRTSWLQRPVGAEPHWGNNPLPCPYGQPGERLWVRESWTPDPVDDGDWNYTSWAGCKEGRIAGVPERFRDPGHVIYAAHWEGAPLRWTPSIHMPRWASRIRLEITEVRAERLQDITEADARAEGITDGGCLNCGNPEPCGCSEPAPDARDSYARLWMSINGDESWAANPWVWVVKFKVVQP